MGFGSIRSELKPCSSGRRGSSATRQPRERTATDRERWRWETRSYTSSCHLVTVPASHVMDLNTEAATPYRSRNSLPSKITVLRSTASSAAQAAFRLPRRTDRRIILCRCVDDSDGWHQPKDGGRRDFVYTKRIFSR